MQKQKEDKLIDLFRKMSAKDQDAMLAFAVASVRENPKKATPLRLVIGGRRAA